jgi:hypothetical protein
VSIHKKLALGIAGMIGLVVSTVFVIRWFQDQAEPPLSAMRAYRLSKLTDEQLRELHARAESEHDRIWQEAKVEGEQFWKKWGDECGKAADAAYKARHPEACSLPLTWQMIGKPLDQRTVSQIFEGYVLGACNLAYRMSDAKRYDCLPH